jgi:hypothetical protein
MSLDCNYTKIRDFDKLTENEKVTRDALAYSTMVVGIGEITDTNVEEFFSRINFYEKVHGNYRYINGESKPFTRADVERFVGLRTNVFPKVTTARFIKNVFEAHERFLPRD